MKKDAVFEWTKECQTSFDLLKKRFSEEPVLMMPNQTKPFQIETDASKYASGAILTQTDMNGDRHPIKHNRNDTIVETPTLIDSGAGGTFIDQNYVRRIRYKLTELETLVKAYNVDCQKPLLKLNGIMTSMIENSWQSYEL